MDRSVCQLRCKYLWGGYQLFVAHTLVIVTIVGVALLLPSLTSVAVELSSEMVLFTLPNNLDNIAFYRICYVLILFYLNM